ncbi:hypothetical protein [Qipengyuania spongiae]|uniref:DUF3618 domain-containing protein n=1 Tax=Qipengyuania spongiae TaxID=2909673 RepID=A0ABY5T1I3_9SPHN|nr:hypothetical protein [Qipengyuania spongiae]UVI38794.1 hypothetical protein L1F33_11140 [Qipengyuania spongiae]
MSEETETKVLTDQEKREKLREKIEAAEVRNNERSLGDQARDALNNATEFVKERPLTAVAGVAVVALAIGAMTRPGRRLGRRTGVLAASATDAALAYALDLMDRTQTAGAAALRESGDALEDFSDTLGSKARKLRRDAAYRTDSAGDALRSKRRKAGRKTSRGLRDLRERFSH